MKKVIFSAIVAFLLVSVAFGQKTNTEVANIIKMSKEHNAQFNGVEDPNKIQPGQILTFLFKDGAQHQIMVQEGDNQWDIVRNKLVWFENIHGQVINYDSVSNQSSNALTQLITPEPIKWHWWYDATTVGILLAILCGLLILAKLLQIRHNNRNQNPVTAGPSQVPGGVNDSTAHSRMNEVARNQYPGAQIQIKNIRRGWLSGLANVYYADGKSKKLKLKDVAAYAGETMINGREQTIYFLQGCGNDARQGNYMNGDLEFRPEVVINQDGSENPLPVINEVQPIETASIEEPTTPVVNPGSETHQQRMKALSIIQAEVSKGEVHEVLLDINPDNFGVHIKYKFQPTSKKAEKIN